MRKWDVEQAMEIIQREKVNLTGGVPTIAWHPARAPRASQIRPLQPRDDRLWRRALGARAGQAHLHRIRRAARKGGDDRDDGDVTQHSAEDYLNRPTSAGPPVPVAELKIMDAEGEHELPVGEDGELWAKGPMIEEGYLNKPEETAESFRDGWVRTGDLARVDEEGFLFIVDRAKDIIIRGGENIYSSEVEDVLYAHPAVTDAALIGIPHRTLGEEPGAVVHLAPGKQASEAELQRWVRDRLAAFRVPVAIRSTRDTLPRNANGKILKKDLKGFCSRRKRRLRHYGFQNGPISSPRACPGGPADMLASRSRLPAGGQIRGHPLRGRHGEYRFRR
ncbi:AMP-binding enzyme domain-containing protein [Ditylenchus destructor]|uniref:AMP-binding enzyme domain-containing protein n=1 Tax=Ditylenchus destructor TaxID=166010 RepID=A0AAD4MJK4_9BILA|nr:AMP-binding enzyme domain-containing protein [Ditylenchus destructor]